MYLDLRLRLMGAEGLREILGNRLIEKGREIAERGEVLFYDSTDTEASAVVSGCEVQVSYDWMRDKIRAKCGCHKKERACEHVAALLLTVLKETERYESLTEKLSSTALNRDLSVPVRLPESEGTSLALFVLGSSMEEIESMGLAHFLEVINLAERMGVRNPVVIGAAAERVIDFFGGEPEEAAERILKAYGDDEEMLPSILKLLVRASCTAPTDKVTTTLRLLAGRMGVWDGIKGYLKGRGIS